MPQIIKTNKSRGLWLSIYDNKEKAKYFARSYACISPLQAGLSVLESMGYGVPFITIKDAITGGEVFNIHNGVDGITMDSIEELKDVIADVFNNKQKFLDYGLNAKAFYNQYRKPEDMADGLWNAIQYVLQKWDRVGFLMGNIVVYNKIILCDKIYFRLTKASF